MGRFTSLSHPLLLLLGLQLHSSGVVDDDIHLLLLCQVFVVNSLIYLRVVDVGCIVAGSLIALEFEVVVDFRGVRVELSGVSLYGEPVTDFGELLALD